MFDDRQHVRPGIEGAGGPRRPAARGRGRADGPAGDLTARETQVVERVAAGLTTQQIAADLAISTHTVVTHVRHVYTKWGVTSRRELARRFTDLRAAG